MSQDGDDGMRKVRPPRDGGPGAFGKVRVFNERTSNAVVQVQLCNKRYCGMNAVAFSGNLQLYAPMPGTSPVSIDVVPHPQLSGVECILVNVWPMDPNGNPVGAPMTFGAYGVGRADGKPLNEVTVTLSGDSDVKVELHDHLGRLVRAASQVAGVPSLVSAAPGDTGPLIKVSISCSPESGDVFLQDSGGGIYPLNASVGWQPTPWCLFCYGSNSPYLIQQNGWAGDSFHDVNGSVVLVPGGGAHGLIVIRVSHLDGDWFQLIDGDTGNALTYTGGATPTLGYSPPDMAPSAGTCVQLWKFTELPSQ